MPAHCLFFRRVAFCLAFLAMIPQAYAQDAATLKSRYETIAPRLAQSPFKRPLVLESSESSNELRGDIYAVLDQPYSRVRPALEKVEDWCDILFLPLNLKSCRKSTDGTLALTITRRYDQGPQDAYRLNFAHRVKSGSDYLRVALAAREGPLGTRDYRITLEAAPLPDDKTFIHLAYGYSYGAAARIATRAYLATAGRSKVGFTVVGHDAGGAPEYVAGVRGIAERNAMRYYLAIEAYLDALAAPSKTGWKSA